MAIKEFTKEEARECIQILDVELFKSLSAAAKKKLRAKYVRVSRFLEQAEQKAPTEADLKGK